MAQTGIADAYLASGWCVRCGIKRSAEGNCPNCDHWYTHPLMTIGGPLALSLAILLLVGIRSLREADPGFARFSNGLLHAAPMPAFIDPNPARPLRTAPVVFFSPANPGTPPAVQPVTPQSEKQWAKLESLREEVHLTERGYRTGIIPQSAVKQVSNASGSRNGAQAERSALSL